ncbi:serine/threonine-protein kinase [Mycoplana ramosa]|uniref:Biotin transporter BioY n=1 Tax=Mycoplana ramosa TaxID=40837 RepID=A0ABW3Z195_MYCRA
MSGLEQAIRNALARADSNDPETRARIYQSARNALEAGLRKQEINDPEAIAAQRHRLEVTIRQIESEQRAAIKAERPLAERTPVAPQSAANERGKTAADAQVRPQRPMAREKPPATAAAVPMLDEIRPDRGDGFGAAAKGVRPAAVNPAGQVDATVAASPRMAKAPRRRGRLFSFLLVVATLAAAIGTAAWWVQSSGLLLPPGARDGSVANPPQTVRGEDFSGNDPVKEALDTQNTFSADWREVFEPSLTSALTAGAKGRFEPVSTDEGPAVRLVSQVPDRDGAVAVSVEPEVLQAMAGKTSTIALTVEAESGKPVQVSVECDFATLGDCDRHRFAVSDRTDLLFQVTFDRTLSPNGAGRLFINSDVSGGGAAVNLFAIRVLPGE